MLNLRRCPRSVAVLRSVRECVNRVSPADWSCPGPGWSCPRPATEPVRRRGLFRSRSSAAGRAWTQRTSLCRYGDAAPRCPQTAGVDESALSVCFMSRSVQVEEGSAKPGRDFTHSTAGLIQFDPGAVVNMEVRRQKPLKLESRDYKSQKAVL